MRSGFISVLCGTVLLVACGPPRMVPRTDPEINPKLTVEKRQEIGNKLLKDMPPPVLAQGIRQRVPTLPDGVAERFQLNVLTDSPANGETRVYMQCASPGEMTAEMQRAKDACKQVAVDALKASGNAAQ
jgi:hypothetical protein